MAVTHDDRYFDQADRVFKLEEGQVVAALRHELAAQPEQVQSGGNE